VENQEGYANLCALLSMPQLTTAGFRERSAGLLVANPAHLALPEIRYATPGDQTKFNIVQSIRTLTRLNEKHADKCSVPMHWPTSAEVAHHWSPTAMEATHEWAERCNFAFEFNRLCFPRYLPADGSTPHHFLCRLAFEGLRERYGPRAELYESQLRRS
jgi:DNA polymerase III alpha subunit